MSTTLGERLLSKSKNDLITLKNKQRAEFSDFLAIKIDGSKSYPLNIYKNELKPYIEFIYKKTSTKNIPTNTLLPYSNEFIEFLSTESLACTQIWHHECCMHDSNPGCDPGCGPGLSFTSKN